MRPGFNFMLNEAGATVDEMLQFSAQLGATDVIVQVNPPMGTVIPGEERWEVKDLEDLRKHVESYGLHLNAIENVPLNFNRQIMLGGSDRERQIENMIYTVRSIARAGIPILGYNWAPVGVRRLDERVAIRGGALATQFDESALDSTSLFDGREHSEEEMWDNLESWIKIITPVAEEEGIRLGIHPNDPPITKMAGVPSLFRSFDAYKRLIEIVDSPANSIEFCQGTFSEMEDAADGGIYDMIRYFGERDRILYVHFRNVSNPSPSFHEEFINTGYVDMRKAIRIYREVGFDGVIVDDHVPQIVGETGWGFRGRAFAHGYIQALIEGA